MDDVFEQTDYSGRSRDISLRRKVSGFKFILLFPLPGNAFRKVGKLEESLAFAKEVSAAQDALSHQQRQLIAFLSTQSSESMASRKCSPKKK